MEGFKQQKKIACFKEGGQVAYESRKERKEEEKADIAQDKKIVKKAVGQHESKLHKGEPKTELKLKTGGRAKKKEGTVKKYCGGSKVKKMAEGRLATNILGTDKQNAESKKNLDKIAKQPGVLGSLERGAQKAANFLKGQGAVTDTERELVEAGQGAVSDAERALKGQGAVSDAERTLLNKKKGGKC
jgi:hypothetical protein